MPFDVAYQITSDHEGGYVNDPNDPGGETYRGVARKRHPTWEGWKLIDTVKVKNTKNIDALPNIAEMVKRFYYNEFWIKTKCDELDKINPEAAHELYDSAVNCGPKMAVKFLQRALNRMRMNNDKALFPALVDDGDFGAKTLNALKLATTTDMRRKILLKCQNGEQYMYYCSLPNHTRYVGWFARC